MKIEQIDKIQDILKLLDKAHFDGVTLSEMINHVSKVNAFAKSVSELRDEVNGVLKIDDKTGMKGPESKHGKSK